MHPLSTDETLLESANARVVAEREMAVSAEQLFATLVDERSWTEVSGAIRKVTWTSSKPFAVGTTRTVVFMGGITIEEQFWVWEPNSCMGFAVTASSTRWLRGLVELYEITPITSERCKMRWLLAVSLSGWLGRIEVGIARMFQRNQRQMLAKLERVAANFSSPA
ncbi:hypothetical protein A5790_03030 [Mycobacterium sp. 852002-51152_SCH6134967]|uniref:SRPBCC family protein n=1 Tax=Mycobacterium sp. 852002-51152_SCH6134967 TaxID=1834096 RepID=UPI000800C83F|nr:SRPBCC family protein [Mycobacterium sp. 852002-51152_SCH6134967]OBF98460.1 hypothetical protein A5790_03030 [Mycobacterium sp. 852002-51152_SCH6134967]